MKKTQKNKKYWFENYVPTKNSTPVTYNGIKYLSKTQCINMEGITIKELNEYLKQNGI